MLLRLPANQTQALRRALLAAGENETGGQLFGEQLAPSDFRATDVSFQRRRGSISRFVVDLLQAAGDALGFFNRTGHQYTRFNYIGEWHSHPRFALNPSDVDLATMRTMVVAPGFAGNFAVLLIVKLEGSGLAGRAWVFDPIGSVTNVSLEMES
ncbi:MAG TPA: Mov34/MPN/PAD-1 family protein [Humisphaera sp.]